MVLIRLLDACDAGMYLDASLREEHEYGMIDEKEVKLSRRRNAQNVFRSSQDKSSPVSDPNLPTTSFIKNIYWCGKSFFTFFTANDEFGFRLA
jgi:hypothetical protein